TGMIMEVDMDTVSDPRKGFKTSLGGLVFAFKEPDSLGGSEGITSGKLSAIKNKLAGVESYLYSSSKRNYYYQHIDRNSAADFHLAVEYFKDIDSDFWRSKYFTWDTAAQTSVSKLRDRKLHFGPLWDFDKSIGNVDPTNPGTAFTRSYRGWQANGTGVGKDNRVTFHTHWFVQLWKVPLFRKDLTYRWNNILRDEFWRAAKYDVDQNKAEIGWGAANDRRRWAGSAKLYRPKGSSYDDEVKYVKYWLLNRFSWMDSQL
ncbi:MAG TPA: CotH kinase family protein, partial [Aeromicrobium sp.]